MIILFILNHNFWTRNVRKLIKVLKATDSRLVCNEKLSEMLLSSGWALGQVTWAKVAKNLPHLWCHLWKKMQTRRLAVYFESMNSFLAQ